MDDRKPLIGIRVVGDLPEGVPWWDASALEIRLNPVTRFFQAFAMAIVIAFVLGCVAYAIYGIYTGKYFAGFFLLFALPLIASFRDIPDKLKISGVALRLTDRTIEDFRPLVETSAKGLRRRSLREPLQLTDIIEVSQYVSDNARTEDASNVSSGVEIKLRPGTSRLIGNACIVPTNRTWVFARDLEKLLTYRIAKAKGENPPPPTFQ